MRDAAIPARPRRGLPPAGPNPNGPIRPNARQRRPGAVHVKAAPKGGAATLASTRRSKISALASRRRARACGRAVSPNRPGGAR